jgi:ribose transport system substrate-binding protein
MAFWVAQQILDGKEVPKDLTVPFLKITGDTLDDALATTPVGSVADIAYTRDDAISAIENAK